LFEGFTQRRNGARFLGVISHNGTTAQRSAFHATAQRRDVFRGCFTQRRNGATFWISRNGATARRY